LPLDITPSAYRHSLLSGENSRWYHQRVPSEKIKVEGKDAPPAQFQIETRASKILRSESRAKPVAQSFSSAVFARRVSVFVSPF
jgi:hypothetical protein